MSVGSSYKQRTRV